MANLANLVVSITGNTVSLNKSLMKAEGRVGQFRKNASKALGAVRKAAAGLAIGGGLAIAGFAANSIKDFIQVGDQLDKMAQRTGFSVEALSELKFAAEQSGSSLETIEKGSKTLSSTIFDASKGLTTATDAFDALGLSQEMLAGLSPEEQFLATATALAAVEDASVRSALAQDVFGRAGTELLPLFSEGAEGMAALRQQAIDLGNTFTTEAAAKAADFNDALNELKQGLGGIGKGIAEGIVPILTNLVDWFTANRPAIEEFLTKVKEKAAPFIDAFVSGAGFILEGLGSVLGWIQGNKPVLIAAIAAIGVAIVLALGPVSLAVLAILGIVTAIGFVRDNWDEIWGKVLKIWDDVSGKIEGVYKSNLGWLLPAGPLIKALLFVRDNWEDIWDTIRGAWDTVSGVIKDAYKSNLGWLLPGGALVKALGLLKENWDGIWAGIRNGFDAFISPIRAALEALSSLIGGVSGALGGISGAISGAGNFLGNIPGFQNGVSNFRGGLAVVGEGGPELVNLPRGSGVTPNGAGGVGNTYNIIFNGDVYGGDDFDRRVNEARLRWQREGN